MEFEITYQLRAFPVEIKDQRTGEHKLDTIVLDKRTLENARAIGIDQENLIWRLYNRKGYFVIRIGVPVKQEARVDLMALYQTESGNTPPHNMTV